MNNVRNKLKKINITGKILFQEDMKEHTSFRVGGPADIYIQAATTDDVRSVLAFTKEHTLPCFILGKGANIVVSDRGFRGIVLDMTELNAIQIEGDLLSAQCGADVSKVAEAAADAGLGGLEFIYAMPGSLGGALHMNARCYGASISDILHEVQYLSHNGSLQTYQYNADDWEYKHSPFQGQGSILLEAKLQLTKRETTLILESMEKNAADREAKGHFRYPCAGSAFKNNREYRKPSGLIIDECGLKGKQIGGAQVAPFHGNIIINTGTAKASEIRELTLEVQRLVYAQTGFLLETEILFVGDWEAPASPN